MPPKRKPRVSQQCTNPKDLSESEAPSTEDPELEAILARTENEVMDSPDEMGPNEQPKLKAEEATTPISVYVGCLVPPPVEEVNDQPMSPLYRQRSPREIERYHKSRERFMRRLHKIKRQTRTVVKTMTTKRAVRDIKRIYAAMREAKLNQEPFCIKRLFERESDSE